MMTKNILILNCQDCPFANLDFTLGFNYCNLADSDFNIPIGTSLPDYKVHDECPLKKDEYNFTVKNLDLN